VLNIFYNNDHGDFNISQFPDRYRDEWIDNAEWLRLSFHAWSEFPDRPYQYATPEKLAHDFDLVRDEIVRFAGEETFIPPSVIHWGMVHPDSFKALTDRGVTTLDGQFIAGRVGVGQECAPADATDVGYNVDLERAKYLVERTVLHDFDRGITFMRGDVCCNLDDMATIERKLNAKYANPYFDELVGLCSHEQYSFPFYKNYIPEHFERMEAAVKSVTEHGYKPAFFQEGFMGNPTLAP
jgi:hypothetical protein